MRKADLPYLHGLLVCASLACGPFPAHAQSAAADAADDGEIQHVEITGSSIAGIPREGALPLLVLSRYDIQRTGVATLTDLIQLLPVMQSFVPASSSIGATTTGGGNTTAALHALPSKYTLVLLDGQRMAPMALSNAEGGGFGVNLESIPLDAIERVEILSDGASALYGSDAIAGVVNLITRKNKSDGDAYLQTQQPQHPGGRSYAFGLSKGFGDLAADGYNLLAAYSREYQGSIEASQRSFTAPGGYFPFTYNGKNYIFNAGSSNTQPANLVVSALPAGSPAGTKATSYSINPYYAANGNCGNPLAYAVTIAAASGTAPGISCRFNFYSLAEDAPATLRDSGLLKGRFKLAADTALWGELVLSRADVNAQFSPSAQQLGVSATNSLSTVYNAYVQPFLTANNLVINPGGSVVSLNYRTVAAGGRADDWITDAGHVAFGVDGMLAGWNTKASLTLSHSVFKDDVAAGYTDFDALTSLIAAGTVDPVMGTGNAALNSAMLTGTNLSTADSDLDTLHLGAQHTLFDLPGGSSIVSLGGDAMEQRYRIAYSPLLLSGSGFEGEAPGNDFPVGGGSGRVPFDASRSNWGLYGEWLLPWAERFETTLSARYDSYGKTRSDDVYATTADPATHLFDRLPNADLGNTFGDATYKLSFRWAPQDNLLLRGAAGTGFKAPSIVDIASVVTAHGNTSGNYPCPFPGSVGCLPGSAQYDLLAGGNGLSGEAGLKPEKSKQWTLGLRIEPTPAWSLGADVWNVSITSQVLSAGIAEQVAFANPQQYAGLFVNPYLNPAGFYAIALEQVPLNGGVAHYRGIDWNLGYHSATSLGKLAVDLSGATMLKQDYTTAPGGAVLTDLGVYGPDQAVVLRTQMRLTAALQNGPWTHTATASFRSGYRDQAYAAGTDIFLQNTSGGIGPSVAFAGLNVPSYTTFDWQESYAWNKAWTFMAGIRNLFDRDPPFTLHTGGSAVAVGYDARYADPLGRAFYLRGNCRF